MEGLGYGDIEGCRGASFYWRVVLSQGLGFMWVQVVHARQGVSNLQTGPRPLRVEKLKLHYLLGRALGQFIFSLIGLKRILFTNVFQLL